MLSTEKIAYMIFPFSPSLFINTTFKMHATEKIRVLIIKVYYLVKKFISVIISETNARRTFSHPNINSFLILSSRIASCIPAIVLFNLTLNQFICILFLTIRPLFHERPAYGFLFTQKTGRS